MKKLFMLFTIVMITISLGSNEAMAQKERGNAKGNGNGKIREVQIDHNNNTDKRAVILNRPVRRVYVTPANRYGRRPVGVRHDNGKHKGWYKGKAKRRVL